jgi:hypothetical protein
LSALWAEIAFKLGAAVEAMGGFDFGLVFGLYFGVYFVFHDVWVEGAKVGKIVKMS